jgi:hypothetical protein
MGYLIKRSRFVEYSRKRDRFDPHREQNAAGRHALAIFGMDLLKLEQY